MDITDARSRIQDVLFDTNCGFPYVHSRQISDFLDRIETKFNILINDPHWDTVKMFISKYPDLYINKDIFMEFLDDLLQLDFVKYVFEKSDIRTFEVTSSLGSPLAIGKPDNLFEDYEFEQLNKEIDENIKKLTVPKVLKPPVQTTQTHRKNKKQIKEINVSKLLRKSLNHFSLALPLVNTILLIILIALLISQYVSLEKHVYPYIRRFFLYETTEVYWWQKWSVTERFIWTLLEYI